MNCLLTEDGGTDFLTLDGGGPTDYLTEDGCGVGGGHIFRSNQRRYVRRPVPIEDDEDLLVVALTL